MWIESSFEVAPNSLSNITENSVIDLTFVDVRDKQVLTIYFNPAKYSAGEYSLVVRHDDMKVASKLNRALKTTKLGPGLNYPIIS